MSEIKKDAMVYYLEKRIEIHKSSLLEAQKIGDSGDPRGDDMVLEINQVIKELERLICTIKLDIINQRYESHLKLPKD